MSFFSKLSIRSNLEKACLAAWYAPPAQALPVWLRALAPLGFLFRVTMGWRQWLYASGLKVPYHPPVPTWVIGNVVVGGVGKTPFVHILAEHLKTLGHRPGLVCRGYGRKLSPPPSHSCHSSHSASAYCPSSSTHVIDPSSDSPQSVGDEAYWLSQQTGLPVVVGSNRAKAIQTLLQAHPEIDCLLMDDGWQHKKVQTDGALLVWDERGLGNGRLLPQGPLREPWPPASSDRVPQALIHMRQHRQEASDSHDKAVPTVPTLPGIPSFEVTRRLACYAQDRLGRQRAYFEGELIAVAGIAKPEVFFSMLGQAPWNLALKPEDAWALPDHASFDTKSVVQRIQAALDQGKTLLCTEKDAVKLWALWPDAAIWAVPLILDIPFDFWTWWDQSRAKDPCLAMSQLS